MQSKTIINLLCNETITNFIGQRINDDVKKMALEAKKYADIDFKALLTLISLYQKAELKLPEHYKKRAALNAKSYEQSTSETIANYKANIMLLTNKRVINVTGGIGIDDWAMAKYASHIDSCEIDEDIHQMAVYNIDLFKNKNIERHLLDGIEFVKNSNKTDIIYIDPDRRPNASRVFRIEDSQPNVLKNIKMLLEKADEVWMKISPMADITYLKISIPSIQKLYVIAWLGEVKEILICCSKKEIHDKKVIAVNVGSKKTTVFENQEKSKTVFFGNYGKYLYEPNRAIIKAGLGAQYASYMDLAMISKNSYFYISDIFKPDFDGRTFEIIEQLLYKPKTIKTYFEKNGIKQANITTRNFRETPEALKSRFKLKDGGNTTLCFTLDNEGQSWLFHCNQI